MFEAAETTALAADVHAALARYDESYQAAALSHAADVLVRDDGVVPPDPAEAQALGRTRLDLWVMLLSRFGRDLPAGFDPNAPPPMKARAPMIDGQPLAPWMTPADIKDPAVRRQYEADIAATQRRVQEYAAQLELYRLHRELLQRAVDSLAQARQTLGLTDAAIAAATGGATLMAGDGAALAGAPAR